MTPWAAEKFKDVRPPFGALQTFNDTNDPVQRYCDPPGVPRIYMYPWEITFIQTPKIVYILYEYTKVWREIYMDRDHPKDPDSSWMGDSIGKYEGDTFVIDTIGFNDKTWLDQTGHPHSDALHVIERFRRLDHDRLEVSRYDRRSEGLHENFLGGESVQADDRAHGRNALRLFRNERVSGKRRGQDANAAQQVELRRVAQPLLAVWFCKLHADCSTLNDRKTHTAKSGCAH